MPPRISLPVRLRVPSAPSAPSLASSALRAFSTTPANSAAKNPPQRRHRDQYAQAQAAARKAANISRQAALRERRRQDLGDPVRGVTTPFVESFDTGLDQSPETAASHLNHYLSPEEIEESLENSDRLATPSKSDADLPSAAQQQASHVGYQSADSVAQRKGNATAAIQRIVNLANGNSKDRLRVNIQRCIDKFGRHETDKFLEPKATASEGEQVQRAGDYLNPEALRRAGADTGSSEVQIAVLTAKIRTLSSFLETRGRKDKVNKRNLRLLVHRRQKLLRYLRKKERGGPRWQHLVETLGLTDGTWKGEISL